MWRTNGPTDTRTWVGARDACASKNHHCWTDVLYTHSSPFHTASFVRLLLHNNILFNFHKYKCENYTWKVNFSNINLRKIHSFIQKMQIWKIHFRKYTPSGSSALLPFVQLLLLRIFPKPLCLTRSLSCYLHISHLALFTNSPYLSLATWCKYQIMNPIQCWFQGKFKTFEKSYIWCNILWGQLSSETGNPTLCFS